MADLKEKNPKITGRSSRAILESIKERSADFDIPREWFSNPALYFEQPFETKTHMLVELFRPITPDILFQEAQRYFDFFSEDQLVAILEGQDREPILENILTLELGEAMVKINKGSKTMYTIQELISHAIFNTFN